MNVNEPHDELLMGDLPLDNHNPHQRDPEMGKNYG